MPLRGAVPLGGATILPMPTQNAKARRATLNHHRGVFEGLSHF